MDRWIVHVDMDAFFAAVEQRDQPELQGRPVVVGGCGARGVVSTASYEARKYGVHSAMAMAKARRLCPQAVFLPPDHVRYQQVSRQIRAIIDRFSPLVEPLSLDEAFLDVSGMELLYNDPVQLAQTLKQQIRAEVGLTASAGVAPNKFLAKLASDIKKPDGLFVITPSMVGQFLAAQPINRLWGVGRVTAETLLGQGIRTIGQIQQLDLKQLAVIIGSTSSAQELQQLANGHDERPVVIEQQPKSVGNEETYETDITDAAAIRTRLLALAVNVAWRLRVLELSGRTVTVKIRWGSFKTITRSRTLSEPTCLDNVLFNIAWELAAAELKSGAGIRLLGLSVTGLTSGCLQQSLFDQQHNKQVAVAKTVDQLRNKFGKAVISRAGLL